MKWYPKRTREGHRSSVAAISISTVSPSRWHCGDTVSTGRRVGTALSPPRGGRPHLVVHAQLAQGAVVLHGLEDAHHAGAGDEVGLDVEALQGLVLHQHLGHRLRVTSGCHLGVAPRPGTPCSTSRATHTPGDGGKATVTLEKPPSPGLGGAGDRGLCRLPFGDVWGRGAGTHVGHGVVAAGGDQAELLDVGVGFHGLADGLQRGDRNVLRGGDTGVPKGMGTSPRGRECAKGDGDIPEGVCVSTRGWGHPQGCHQGDVRGNEGV